MLVLTRKTNESICISGGIEVFVVRVTGNKVRLGFRAPSDVLIQRKECVRDPAEITRQRRACCGDDLDAFAPTRADDSNAFLAAYRERTSRAVAEVDRLGQGAIRERVVFDEINLPLRASSGIRVRVSQRRDPVFGSL